MPFVVQDPIGRQIRIVRLELGLTLDDVVAMSGGKFKRNALSNYERGERPLTVRHLLQLAEVYGVEPARLLPEVAAPVSADQMTIDEAAVYRASDRFECEQCSGYVDELTVRREAGLLFGYCYQCRRRQPAASTGVVV